MKVNFKFFDYDSLENYSPGSFNAKYKTILEDKVRIIKTEPLSKEIVDSFLNGNYYTCITKEEIYLYRIFGQCKFNERIKGARVNGSFATTEFAESLVDVKVRLALDPSWLNTKMYEAKILVPRNTKLHVGIVAPRETQGGGVLEGGAEQVILPFDWPKDWIIGYRWVQRQLHKEPIYDIEEPKDFDNKDTIYTPICPYCGGRNVEPIDPFYYKGSKGILTEARFLCVDEMCKCIF